MLPPVVDGSGSLVAATVVSPPHALAHVPAVVGASVLASPDVSASPDVPDVSDVPVDPGPPDVPAVGAVADPPLPVSMKQPASACDSTNTPAWTHLIAPPYHDARTRVRARLAARTLRPATPAGYRYLPMPRRDHDDFDGSRVIETDTMVLFWQPPAVFGQWTPSPFTVDGVDYGCAEQYMMAAKARLFGDHQTLAKILATTSPREHKALGRQVAGFVSETWERECLAIVVAGNRAKFSQNPDMRAALLATGDKLLVEASPLDKVWGVGLRADDPRIHDRSQWRGTNLLGEALMIVRAELAAQPAA